MPSWLCDPAGRRRGEVLTDGDSEAILRVAWGLEIGDMLVPVLDGRAWALMVVKQSGTGNRLIPLGPRTATEDGDPQVLYELAALDLWDQGWKLEKRHE